MNFAKFPRAPFFTEYIWMTASILFRNLRVEVNTLTCRYLLSLFYDHFLITIQQIELKMVHFCKYSNDGQ